MKFKRLIFYFAILISIFSYSQQENLTLEDFMIFARNSVEAKKFEKTKIINEKEYSLYYKDFLPDVSLTFTLPSYNRSISEVLQPNGNFAFRESNNANSRVNLSVSQKLPFTGGEITIVNSLNRLDLFGDNGNSTSYSASWFGINISQPLNFFNSMKWDQKIQEAQKRLNEINYKKDEIGLKKKAINLYFELWNIKNEINVTKRKLDVSEKYKDVVTKLIKNGRALGFDSIDVELKLLDAQGRMKFLIKSEALLMTSISNYFNMEKLNNNFSLDSPIFDFKLKELDFYINKYEEIYPIIEENRLLGLQKNIKQLEKNRLYSGDLSLGIGFNNTSDNYDNIFQDPNQSQNFSISLNIPLLDFGKKKIELEISKIQYEIAESSLKQEKFSTIERVSFLYEEIKELISSLKIEESRVNLLEIKLKRMEALLYSQKVLLKDYSETEEVLFTSIANRVNIIGNIYNKIMELEEVLLLQIL